MSDEFENVEMTEETEDLMDDEITNEETEASSGIIAMLAGKATVLAAGMAVGAAVSKFGKPALAAAGAKVSEIREARRAKKVAKLKGKLDKLEGTETEDPAAKKK